MSLGLPGIQRPDPEFEFDRQFAALLARVAALEGGIKSTVPSVALTGQTAAIASTTLLTLPTPGRYLLLYSVRTTTVSGAGAPTVSALALYTDDAQAETVTVIATHSLSALGASSGYVIAKVASGSVNYQTTIAGAAGTPQYALDIVALRLP